MTTPDFLKAIWIRLTIDKRRFGVLCSLLGLGLLLWARLILATDLPKMAIADSAAPAPVKTSNKRQRPLVNITLDESTDRDPFVIDARTFPSLQDPNPDLPDPGKSGSEPAEDPEQVESRLLRQYRSIVDALRLDACMPTAGLVVIEGERYRVGDQLPVATPGQRLVVAEVRQRSVVLDAGDRRFELKMGIPGG